LCIAAIHFAPDYTGQLKKILDVGIKRAIFKTKILNMFFKKNYDNKTAMITRILIKDFLK